MNGDRIIDGSGSPVQQSMTARPQDYVGLNLTRTMLGVVLDVTPANDERNRSSYQREDRRGYLHTCTVLVIQDGRGTHFPLQNVIITPDSPSGLDDYYERLPRGSSSLTSGENYNNQLNHINPYDLDGDWCVVGFLGGSLDMPYVVRWWPHPHNPYDPLTSGNTNPNSAGSSPTLVQDGRYLHRINGVEFVVTKQGHIYVSTTRTNSNLSFGADLSPEEGRFPRSTDEDNGGSFKMWVKPSQSFELDFNEQEDGIGVEDVQDDQLPQTNPGGSNTSNGTKDNTYVKLTKERAFLTVSDEIKLNSKKRILLTSDEETTLTVGDDLTLDVSGDMSVSTDGGLTADVTQDLSVTVTGQTSITARTTLDVQVTGTATINSMAELTLSATGVLTLGGSQVTIGSGGASGGPGSISATPAGVDIGTGALGGAVGGTALEAAVTAFAVACRTAAASATVESVYANAIATAAEALAAAIPAAVSGTTRVG